MEIGLAGVVNEITTAFISVDDWPPGPSVTRFTPYCVSPHASPSFCFARSPTRVRFVTHRTIGDAEIAQTVAAVAASL